MDIHTIVPASLKRHKQQVFSTTINLLFILTLVLAALVRIPLLSGSFWLDEAAQALESQRPLSQQFNIVDDFQPPLLHLIVHFAMYLSDQEWWLRFWGAYLPGVATVAFTFFVGKQLKLPLVGLSAAILLATNSFHIFYSQELRPYSLPAFLAVFCWWVLFRWLQDGRATSRVGWIAASIAGIYSSYLFPFNTLAQLVYMFWWYRKKSRETFINAALIGIAFAPWLPMLLQQLSAGQLVRQQLPGWEDVVGFTPLKVLPILFGKFVFGVIDLRASLVLVSITLLLVLLTFIALQQELLRTKIEGQKFLKKYFSRSSFHPLASILMWLFVPLFTALVISFFIPVLQPKRVLYLLPAFYLCVSMMAFWFKHRLTTYVFLMTLLFINTASLLSYWSNPRLQRENWRQLHSEIEARFDPEKTLLIFSHPEPFAPWRWYDNQQYPTQALGKKYLHVNQLPSLSEHFKQATEFQYILVFDYLRDLSDPNDLILVTLRDLGFQEIGALDQPNVGFVRIYVDSHSLTAYNGDS